VGPGDIVGDRFELLTIAGRGGMGDVYRAREVASGATVAIKVLRKDAEAPVERFTREARMLASLRHPAIVAYVGHGTTNDGEHWLAMEWLEGESLQNRLSRGPLTPSQTMRVLERVTEALAVAHPLDIVHRDLKPSNIFLVDRALDKAKVLDFGIARPLGSARVTATGVLIGTPTYMSPEQARRGRDVDARSDVFSLGCVARACLTGRSPFIAPDVMTVLMKVMLEDPEDLARLRPDAPPPLIELIEKMLAKSPDARPRDAAAVLSELRAMDIDARASAPPSGISRREQRIVVSVIGKRVIAEEPTIRDDDPTGLVEGIGVALDDFGGSLETRADGTFVVHMRAGADPMHRAARCALALQASLHIPLSITIEQRAPTEGITVDEELRALIEQQFELADDKLIAERKEEKPRTALPFVGRDRELTLLRALNEECVTEGTTKTVVISGPPGIGKTRLAHEANVPALTLITTREPKTPGVEHIRLGELSRRAMDKICGDASIVERAAGNPLYLEGLMRGHERAVRLLVQSRLDLLESEARRVLRAASALREPFTLRSLVGLAETAHEWVPELVAREILEPRGDGFVFRHALIRECALSMLTESDRLLAVR
jgi:eukaryotic-like serine/threonine-protein kinase